MNEPKLKADPWDEEIDSFDAALIIGIEVNHLRQIAFKKKLTVVGYKKRRAMFNRQEVLAYKEKRIRDMGILASSITVVSPDLPKEG